MDRQQIMETLKQLEELFEQVGVVRWVEIIREISDPPVVDCTYLKRVRSLISGMGSITDIYIGKVNGFNVEEENEEELNNQLMNLAEKLYQQVKHSMIQLECP